MNRIEKSRKAKAGLLLIASPRFKNKILEGKITPFKLKKFKT